MKKTVLLAALLMIGSLAFAQKNERRSTPGRFQKTEMGWIGKGLDLSEDQQAKVKELRNDHLKKTSVTKNELKVKRAELEAAIEVDKPDRKKIDLLVSEINELQGAIFTERINHKMEVRSLLDDEQKLKFDQMGNHGSRYSGKPGRGR